MRRLCLLLVACLLLAGGLALASAKANDPLRLVQDTADRVLHEVKRHKAELEADPGKIYQLVDQLILPQFDFSTMSRLVLGKYWRRARPEQQDAFLLAFRELLVRTYAKALLNYSDQEIVYQPLRQQEDANKVTVSTLVQEPGGAPVPIDYKLHRKDGKWKVYDVTIDGVSLVLNYRSSFRSQIRRYKLDGLIERLQSLNRKQTS